MKGSMKEHVLVTSSKAHFSQCHNSRKAAIMFQRVRLYLSRGVCKSVERLRVNCSTQPMQKFRLSFNSTQYFVHLTQEGLLYIKMDFTKSICL